MFQGRLDLQAGRNWDCCQEELKFPKDCELSSKNSLKPDYSAIDFIQLSLQKHYEEYLLEPLLQASFLVCCEQVEAQELSYFEEELEESPVRERLVITEDE